MIDLTRFPYRLRTIAVPDCQVGEDLVVSEDNKTWYSTLHGFQHRHHGRRSP